MKKFKYIIFIYLFSSSIYSIEKINIPFRDDVWNSKTKYYIELLTIVLDKTEPEYGPYEIVYAHKNPIMDKIKKLVPNGPEINLTWLMTSNEREELFSPIRIPLLKGLLGMRVAIIRPDQRELFKDIRSLEDLKKFKPVQGTGWVDSDILEYNNIDVYRYLIYPRMFNLVSNHRVDYFPRSIHEAYGELESRKRMGLLVDDNILIKYTAPIYFFVRHEDKVLKERIEKGLTLMIEDGSFDHFFYNFPANKYLFENGNLENRVVIELDNPFLPPETPVDDERLWVKF